MMRRIGFRRLLLPVQLALFGVLSLIASWERVHQQPCSYVWSSLDFQVFAQEGPGTGPFPAPCHEPRALLIVLPLNLPAALVGLILQDSLLHRSSDAWLFLVSAPAVVLLWYLVGLWIDRRLGFVALPKGRRFPPIFARLAFGLSVLILIFAAIVVLRSVLSHHRIEEIVVATSIAGWSGFLFVVTRLNLRRSLPPFSAESLAPSPHQ
jgi:hypothetical protein